MVEQVDLTTQKFLKTALYIKENQKKLKKKNENSD